MSVMLIKSFKSIFYLSSYFEILTNKTTTRTRKKLLDMCTISIANVIITSQEAFNYAK